MSRFDSTLLARATAWVMTGSTKPPVVEVSPEPAKLAVEVAAALCRRFEGYYSHPYLCPAGVPTIGWGATYYLDGRRVTLKDPPISREAADRLLLKTIERVYLPAVLKLCPNIRDPNRLAAIIDWTFNLGEANLRSSTLRKRINAERWDLVPTELRKWRFAAGRELRGLVLRREAEAVLV